MIVYYIGLYSTIFLENKIINTEIIKNAFNLSEFSYFTRNNIKEFMLFTVNTILLHSTFDKNQNQRITVNVKDYKISLDLRRNNMASIIITDFEYPDNVSFNILNQILYNKETVDTMINKCQDPVQVDKIYKINEDLSKTDLDCFFLL